MAAALRFGARRICARALQRPPQPYFSAVAEATIKEQRLLLPRVSHGGSSLRRFSAESQNHLKNNEHGAVSAANPVGSSPLTNNAQTTAPPPLWSPRNKKFLPLAVGYFTFLCATMSAVLYWDTRPRPISRTKTKKSD